MSQKITVGEEEFVIAKANAAQVSGIAKILSRIGASAGKSAGDLADGDYLSVIAAIIGSVSEEELIELAALCIGSDKAFAKENFDLVWVSEALVILIEETNLSAVVRNFMRIASLLQG